MRNVKVENARAAVAGLFDGATVMIGGFGGAGRPGTLVSAVLETGVRNLTVISNNAGSPGDELARWFEAKIVRKIICTYPRGAKSFAEQYRAGTVELELVPQGTLVERIRCAGAGLGGFLSRVGVGTQFAEGKRTVTMDGKEYLIEPPLRADFAFLKARRADTFGNLVYNKAARNHQPVMATAAKTVVAEVAEIVEPGTIDPETIVTPCIFVDRVVLS